MRIALLAATLAFLAYAPASAQCIYVACQGDNQGPPVYQHPIYQAPLPQPRSSSAHDYEAGYAAGVAAHRPTARPKTRRTQSNAQVAPRHTSKSATVRRLPSHARVTPSVKRRSVATTSVATTRGPAHRIAAQRPVTRHYVSHHAAYDNNPIKDRAATYRPQVYGQSTDMGSLMTSASSYSSYASSSYTDSISWAGPTRIVHQGGQICGWGTRIVTHHQGYAQRQAAWVCQCPQGWRPPGC